MRKSVKTWAAAGLASLPLLLAGCTDKEEFINNGKDKVDAEIENAFDYNLVAGIPVTVDYPGVGIVSIYDKHPNEAGARMIYTLPVGYNGKGKGVAYLPKSYIGTTVYAVEKYNPYNPDVTEAKVEAGGISITGTSSRAVKPGQKETIGNDIMLGVLSHLPNGINNSKYINENFPEDKDLDITLKKDATVKVTFIQAGGEFYEKLCYYEYKGDKPTQNKIDLALTFYGENNTVFSGINQDNSTTNAGNTWSLGQNGGFIEKDYQFTKGQKITFTLNNTDGTFYTAKSSYNPDGRNHAGRFTYYAPNSSEADGVIYAFEDAKDNSDEDYNDLVILVTATPADAIVDPDDPIIKPPYDITLYSEEHNGTVLFEDLYPSQGDYDMNDFVAEYSMKTRMHVTFDPNKNTEVPPYHVEALEYSFTPKWDGANYGQKFSFRFYDKDNVGLQTASTDIYTLAAGDNKGALTVESISGELSLGNMEIDNKTGFNWNAFDPYVTVLTDTEHEVHLTKRSATPGANADITDPYLQKFVNSEANYPFAMQIPAVNYGIVSESTRIDAFYPDYVKWVESNGEKAADWYLHPAE